MAEKKPTVNIVITNKNTGEHIELSAKNEEELDTKVDAQYEKWNREQHIEDMKEKARQMTNDRSDTAEYLYAFHKYVEAITPERFYRSLLDNSRFYLDQNCYLQRPDKKSVYKKYKVPFDVPMVDAVFIKRKEKRDALVEQAEADFEARTAEYNKAVSDAKNRFEKKKDEHNSEIQRRYNAFIDGDIFEIQIYFKAAIENNGYPACLRFTPGTDILYADSNKTIIVTSQLPGIHGVPRIKEYKYNPKQEKVEAVRMPDSEFKSLYEHVLFGIALRNIGIIFDSNKNIKIVEYVIFNGVRKRLDRSCGKYIDDCLISIKMSRNDYYDVNLELADSKDVIKRIVGNITTDFIKEPIKAVNPLFDNGKINNYY